VLHPWVATPHDPLIHQNLPAGRCEPEVSLYSRAGTHRLQRLSVNRSKRVNPMLLFLLGVGISAASAQGASYGAQHVGAPAKELRDKFLEEQSGPVHKYNPETQDTASTYEHMPLLELHPSGEMDVISIEVVGSDKGQNNPFGSRAIWVEDEDGKVVYLHEDATRGGFAVPEHLLGSVLTGYNLDSSGLWLGPPLEVPLKDDKDEL
jgi:hypothetical protein